MANNQEEDMDALIAVNLKRLINLYILNLFF
jgi:hypothetical protein